MRDQRLDKLADVLVNYSTRVKKGETVAITADPLAFPLVEACYAAVLRAGGHPFWMVRSEPLIELKLAEGSSEQIEWVSAADTHVAGDRLHEAREDPE